MTRGRNKPEERPAHGVRDPSDAFLTPPRQTDWKLEDAAAPPGMLEPRALRFALMDLAEYGRVHVRCVGEALQIAGAWAEEARLAASDTFWTVTVVESSADSVATEPAGAGNDG